jgi:hypothetical protein
MSKPAPTAFSVWTGQVFMKWRITDLWNELAQPVAKGRFDLQVLARNLGHEHAPAGGRVE